MIVEGYSLHLYCDASPAEPGHTYAGSDAPSGDGFGEFGGKSRAEAVRSARAAGWYVGRERCLCPTHAHKVQS